VREWFESWKDMKKGYLWKRRLSSLNRSRKSTQKKEGRPRRRSCDNAVGGLIKSEETKSYTGSTAGLPREMDTGTREDQ
jgi:hypothetical protein